MLSLAQGALRVLQGELVRQGRAMLGDGYKADIQIGLCRNQAHLVQPAEIAGDIGHHIYRAAQQQAVYFLQ